MAATNGMESWDVHSVRLDTYQNPDGQAVKTHLDEHDIPYTAGVCGMVDRHGDPVEEPALTVRFGEFGYAQYRGPDIRPVLEKLAQNDYVLDGLR